MAAQHSDKVIQAVDEHHQPQIVCPSVEKAQRQPGNRGKHHRGKIQMGHSKHQCRGHNGKAQAISAQRGEDYPPEGKLFHKGNQHRHHSDFQQDGRPGFPLGGIAPRGTVPKKAKKLLYKQGGVIPQQGDGQASQHTEQPPCKAHPLKLQIMCGVFLPEEQVCREGQRRGQGHQHGGKPLISHGVGEDIHSQHRQQEHQGNLPHKGKPRLR